MDKQKALELIKQVIDQAIKGGLFQNVETAIAVGQAFAVIENEIKEKLKDESQPQ